MRAELLGKLRRAAGMSAAEVGYRLAEKARRRVDRAASLDGQLERRALRLLRRGPADGASGFGDYLRRVAAPRFYLPSDEVGRKRFAHRYRDRFPGRLAALAAEAERLCAHRVELLGLGELTLGDRIDWHRDPATGRVWDRRYWASYDLVRESTVGDPKTVLELNRHQHLPRLAAAYWLLGDERWAREAVRQMLGWVEQNPPGRGVNWHSSLELALRSLSWLWTIFLLAPSAALDDETLTRLAASLFAQLEHVDRYPSIYSSPNTHLLGEAAALFIAGLLFPECERGADWERRGRELLERALARQVGDDGVHRELSLWYHCYALDFSLQAMALARRCGRPLAAPVEARIESLAVALRQLVRPDGTLPRIGDDDGGRALALVATSYDRADDLLSTGAVLFGRAELLLPDNGVAPESFWLLGAAAVASFEALGRATPAGLAAAFPDAGYYVHRSGWGAGDSHLIFDCGGLGEPGGGHGHADALAITLAAGGRELLVDPGTFVYNGNRPGRDHFRSTRSHNTATVDGHEQSVPAGTFAWRRRAEVRRLESASFGDLELVAGEHAGLGASGVTHRRRVLYARPDYWLVVDSFRGAGEHLYEVFFHLAPGLSPATVELAAARRDARVATVGEGAGLALAFHGSAPLEISVSRGEASEHGAWVSRRYGEKRPAESIAVRLRAPAPVTLVTVIAPLPSNALPGSAAGIPYPAAAEPSLRAPGLDGAVATSIRFPGGEDIVIAGAEEQEVEAGSCRGRGELLWLRRRREGTWSRLLAVEARSFEVAGEPLLSSWAPVTGLLCGPPLTIDSAGEASPPRVESAGGDGPNEVPRVAEVAEMRE